MVIAEQIKGTYIIGLLQGYLMDEDTITDWIEQLQSELVLMSNRLLLVSKIEVVAFSLLFMTTAFWTRIHKINTEK